MKRLRFLPKLLLSTTLSSLLVGCASFHVMPPSPDPDNLGEHKQTLHAFWWRPVEVTTDCRHGIDNLFVDDNLAFDIASVITLGIWKPINVRYECHSPAGIRDLPPSDWTNRIANAYFWGFWYSPQVIMENDAKDAFHSIRVADNLGFDLVSVITLGIWKPMAVQYRRRPDPLIE